MIQQMEPGYPGDEERPVDLDVVQRLMDEYRCIRNTSPDPEMGGLTPEQVYRLSYIPWGEEGSPLQLNGGLTLKEAERSLIFRQARQLLCAIRDAGGVKATASGSLNRKFVVAMMEVLLSEEQRTDIHQYRKVFNEENIRDLHHVRIVDQLGGLIRRYKGKFSVPKTKQVLLAPERAGELFRKLFLTFFVELNLSSIFWIGPEADSLQEYLAYTLYRLGVVASDWHSTEQLPEEVLLPAVRSEVEEEIADREFETIGRLLEYRILRPLVDWGLLEGRYENVENCYVQTLASLRITPLYRDFLQFDMA